MSKILIADDHCLVVEGICSILKKSLPDCEVTAFTEVESLLQDIKTHRYDVYILDLEFRNSKSFSGFSLIEEVRSIHTDAKIIINTMHEEIWTISRLINIDIDGIVLKASASDHIALAVEKVLQGEKYLCPQFCYLKAEKAPEINRVGKLQVKLTDREHIVLKYIAQGFTGAEIARKVHVAEDTVDYHKRNLYAKFGAKNSAELAALAVSQGWIE